MPDGPSRHPTTRHYAGPHLAIGGVPIFSSGIEDTVALVIERLRAGKTTRIATANLDFLALARRIPQLRHDLLTCDLVVADGAPVTWLAKLAGASGTGRIAGVDLVQAICAAAGRDGGLRVALYGSVEPVAAAAARYLEASFAAVTVTAQICPPFRCLTPAEHAADVARLRESNADVVLVALGCPAQERFAADVAALLPGKVWIGVGGSFDFFAGRRRRAPRMAQRLGLEWVVRLTQEPRRLAGRYLLRDAPEFVRLAPGVLLERVAFGPRQAIATVVSPEAE